MPSQSARTMPTTRGHLPPTMMSPPESRRKPNVLLVDDEHAFRTSTALLLEASGYPCVAASTVDEAMAALESEPFDVVIADICMPGNAGLEFARRAAGTSSSPAIILVTGYPSVDTAVEAVDNQFVGYLVKPFDQDELTRRLERALETRRMRSAVARMREDLSDMDAQLHDIAEGMGSRAGAPADDAEDAAAASATRLADFLASCGLTPREHEIATYLAEGYRVSTIATRLGISPHTARRHLKSIFLKLEVRSQAELLEKLKPWPRSPR